MLHLRMTALAPARIGWLALGLAALAAVPAAAATPDDHQEAVAALGDVKAAINELVRADASYATDRNVYRGASQQAINLLVGEHGDGYVAGSGTTVDAAVAYLQDSLRARELMDYVGAASRAIAYLEVARGRPTETGVLGGLEGVLANTELGVPAGATRVDACKPPSAAPAYGTHDGYVAWIALPGGDGPHTLADATGGNELVVRGGNIVVHTAASALVTAACDRHAAAAEQRTVAASPGSAPARADPGSPPALYTKAQAEEGAGIFAAKCIRCHGANLQGTAAPAVAGSDFLRTAQQNGWTLAMIQYLVVNNMPMNAPESLSPREYASVLAFLLASNCYPAGGKPFPDSAEPAFAQVRLGPLPGEHDGENGRGVCKVK